MIREKTAGSCNHPVSERCEDAANIEHNLRAIQDAGFAADRTTAKRIFEDGYHTGALDGPCALGTLLYHDPDFLAKYGLSQT